MTVTSIPLLTSGETNICEDEITSYLSAIIKYIRIPEPSVSPSPIERLALPEKLFSILTNRRFCYLSKSKSARYRPDIIETLSRSVIGNEPLQFYYDIGGGYHASVRPIEEGLAFRAGLAELFILSQISRFCNEVSRLYPKGTKFFLVIDDLCALFTNDIPIEKTSEYCMSLRSLISDLELDSFVHLLVESEQFSEDAYRQQLEEYTASKVTPDLFPSKHDIENVSRFLGRQCGRTEAAQRIQRYKDVTQVSEHHLESIIDSVHMTQRASETTIAFRPFPGGDSRVQAGEVALSKNSKGKIHPFLLTSQNEENYLCQHFQLPEVLPSSIGHVTYAARIPNEPEPCRKNF